MHIAAFKTECFCAAEGTDVARSLAAEFLLKFRNAFFQFINFVR
jgi:hypothetical protein